AGTRSGSVETTRVNSARAAADPVPRTHMVSRPIRTSERRALLFAGDALAVTAAVGLALWTWSITAGFPFDIAFVRGHAMWLFAIPLWAIGLAPARDAVTAFDTRRSALAIAREAAVLM